MRRDRVIHVLFKLCKWCFKLSHVLQDLLRVCYGLVIVYKTLGHRIMLTRFETVFLHRLLIFEENPLGNPRSTHCSTRHLRSESTQAVQSSEWMLIFRWWLELLVENLVFLLLTGEKHYMYFVHLSQRYHFWQPVLELAPTLAHQVRHSLSVSTAMVNHLCLRAVSSISFHKFTKCLAQRHHDLWALRGIMPAIFWSQVAAPHLLCQSHNARHIPNKKLILTGGIAGFWGSE